MRMTDYSIEHDLQHALHMAYDLERHLYSNVMYGSVGGGKVENSTRTEAVSVGQLICILNRLRALRPLMDDIQRNEVGNICTIYEITRLDNARLFTSALKRELKARIDVIQFFLNDLDQHPDTTFDDLEAELIQRTVVQEMMTVTFDLDVVGNDMVTKVQNLDEQLSALLCDSAPFRWAEVLMTAYPEGTFWWLYRQDHAKRES